jgi:hypothetical protein
MTRAEKSKALAMDILLRCTGYPPSEIMAALTLAMAQIVVDAGREDRSIEDHVGVYSDTLRQTLTWMMEEPPAAGRLQ